MKKVTVLLAFGSLMMCSSIFAQEEREIKVGKVEAMKAEEQEESMEEELNLTEAQKEKMKAIKAKYADKEKAQREQMIALKKSMKEVKEMKRKEMYEVLTPEQKKIADKKREERMQRKKVNKVVQKKKVEQRRNLKED